MLIDNFVPASRPATHPGLVDRLARRGLIAAMRRIEHGCVEVVDPTGHWTFGQVTPQCGLSVKFTIKRPDFYRRVALGGVLGAGESYIAGDWEVDDLTALIRIFAINEQAFAGMNRGLARVGQWLSRGWHALRRNTRHGSRRNIAAHYDLSNDFYKLWLDETMTYSSGYFADENTSLHASQIAKLDRICRRLDLKPDDRVLEIGTGWGSFALHAAEHYGCHVTTTTISTQQYKLAAERIKAAGLSDRITLLDKDYRDLTGRYDKIVSIEMVEAVGWEYYDTYFKTISERLQPDGQALIQAITMADRYYEHAKRNVDFIKRYVFPGSCIPSIGAISQSLSQVGDLMITHLEDFGRDYAHTLRLWRERFFAHLPEIRDLGYSDEFVRLWEFYLCYCEAGFEERSIGVAQLVLGKPGSAPQPISA